MDLAQLTQKTLQRAVEAYRQALKQPGAVRAIDTSIGLYGYNLQRPAQQLVPLLSPFVASIPRRVAPGMNADNWKQITSLSLPELFVPERTGGNLFTTALSPKTAAFKPQRLGGEVTREGQAASETFDDALALETSNTLLLARKLESMAFMGANITDLGTPGAPTVAIGTSVGGLNPSSTTYYAAVVGLTLPAFNRIAFNAPADRNASLENLMAGVARTQAELQVLALGTTAATGCGLTDLGSEGNSGSTTETNATLKVTWAAVPGCVAYLVFVGTTTGAANLKCEGLVTQTQITFTTLAGSGVAANDAAVPAADETGNANHYDGIIPSLISDGGYLINVNETLTGSNSEITEIQDAFAQLWNVAKIDKFRVIVSGQDTRILTRLGVSSNSLQIFAVPGGGDGRLNLTIGAHVGEIVNSVTGYRCPVETDPWLAPGTILILPTEIPYPHANLSAPFEWVGAYDWERWDYASTRSTGPIYPFDIQCYGVLEPKFPGGCAMLYNIWKG
jgi:hypothetical protein